MKSRTIITLWIVTLVLGASVFFLKKNQFVESKQTTKRAPGQTLLADFPVEKVAQIELVGAEKSSTLQLKQGQWTIAQRDDFPANPRAVLLLLRTLSDLKVTQSMEAGPSFAPRFGMDEKASSPEARGLTATFKDESGKELAKVSFGKNLESAASASPFGGGASGRHVRNHFDESGIYAVSELFSSLSEQPSSWLSEDFLQIDQIQSISVTQAASEKREWEMSRSDANADFSFSEAFPGLKADSAATAPLKSLFSFSRFDDVVPVSEVEKNSSPEQIRKAVIRTFDGITYTMTFQPKKSTEAAVSENYLMSVDVEASLVKERAKPEDETKEAAEAAQKAFEEKLKTLTLRVEKAQSFKGRTFEVSKFTLGSLLNSRAAFIEKGKEASTAPAKPDGESESSSSVETPATKE